MRDESVRRLEAKSSLGLPFLPWLRGCSFLGGVFIQPTAEEVLGASPKETHSHHHDVNNMQYNRTKKNT